MTTITWILTADHRHARVFSCDGRGRGLTPVDALTMDERLPAGHEAGSHRPDLGYAAKVGPGRGYEAGTTPHQQAALRFVDPVIAALSEATQHDALQKLIVIVPPRALGELRERLPNAVRNRVMGELNLNLAGPGRGRAGARGALPGLTTTRGR